jgi:hypothetical protein
MTRNHDATRFFQLIPPSGGPVVPWAAGRQARFRFTGVPLLTNGNLCNHALGVLVSMLIPIGAGGINPVGGTNGKLGTAAYCLDDLLVNLVNSVKIEGCLHKEPVNEQTYKAAVLRTIEFVSCGFRYFGRQGPQVLHQASRKNNCFQLEFFIPLTYGLGRKGWQHNALPTFCYENAQLVLNWGPGFLDGGEEGSGTAPGADVRATLVMLPSPEINLAPGTEWIDYWQQASTALNQVIMLEKFGLSTALDNVERGAGVDCLLLASSHVRSLGYQGAAAHRGIRRLALPFRGQESTTHISPFYRDMECALDRPCLPATQDTIEPPDLPVDTVGGDKAGWPYPENYQEPVVASGAFGTDDGIYADDPDWFPLIFPGRDLELSKVASYEADEQVQIDYATGTGPQPGSTHHVLAHQFKSWTPEGWTALMRKAVDSGVAAAVLGTNSVTHSLKLLAKNPDPAAIDLTKVRYFPQKVVPMSAPTT